MTALRKGIVRARRAPLHAVPASAPTRTSQVLAVALCGARVQVSAADWAAPGPRARCRRCTELADQATIDS